MISIHNLEISVVSGDNNETSSFIEVLRIEARLLASINSVVSAILAVSDKHMGLVVSIEEFNNLSSWNFLKSVGSRSP